MSQPGWRKPGYEPNDPLAEMLGADEIVRPRTEFRARLRADLLNHGSTRRAWPLAWPRFGRAMVPSMPAIMAILILAMGTALAAALILNQGLRQQFLGSFSPGAESPVAAPGTDKGPPLALPRSVPTGGRAGTSAAPQSEAARPSPATPAPSARPRLPGIAPTLVPPPTAIPSVQDEPGAAQPPAEKEKPKPEKPEKPADTAVPTAEAPTATPTPPALPVLPATSTPEPTQTSRPTTTPRPTQAPTASPTAGTGITD